MGGGEMLNRWPDGEDGNPAFSTETEFRIEIGGETGEA